jgi:hypothetical protein
VIDSDLIINVFRERCSLTTAGFLFGTGGIWLPGNEENIKLTKLKLDYAINGKIFSAEIDTLGGLLASKLFGDAYLEKDGTFLIKHILLQVVPTLGIEQQAKINKKIDLLLEVLHSKLDLMGNLSVTKIDEIKEGISKLLVNDNVSKKMELKNELKKKIDETDDPLMLEEKSALIITKQLDTILLQLAGKASMAVNLENLFDGFTLMTANFSLVKDILNKLNKNDIKGIIEDDELRSLLIILLNTKEFSEMLELSGDELSLVLKAYSINLTAEQIEGIPKAILPVISMFLKNEQSKELLTTLLVEKDNTVLSSEIQKLIRGEKGGVNPIITEFLASEGGKKLANMLLEPALEGFGIKGDNRKMVISILADLLKSSSAVAQENLLGLINLSVASNEFDLRNNLPLIENFISTPEGGINPIITKFLASEGGKKLANMLLEPALAGFGIKGDNGEMVIGFVADLLRGGSSRTHQGLFDLTPMLLGISEDPNKDLVVGLPKLLLNEEGTLAEPVVEFIKNGNLAKIYNALLDKEFEYQNLNQDGQERNGYLLDIRLTKPPL